ncbi:MAG TPA: hypothetical protein VID48_07265 [Solirubrobacteraceae bacterium]
MDPIRPILPGSSAIPRFAPGPVERITRERDRPDHQDTQRKRQKPKPKDGADPPTDEDGHRHIDVRA